MELQKRYGVSEELAATVERVARRMHACWSDGGRIYVCGNGGSCADSEHIVGELMKSFRLPRPVDPAFAEAYRGLYGEEPLLGMLQGAVPAVSLVSQTALMTAVINDIGSEAVFAQQAYGYVRAGDVLIGISTSGNSLPVLAALKVAKARGAFTVAMTGRGGGKLGAVADALIAVEETETYRVQELHLPVYHFLCARVEELAFGRRNK